MTWSFRARKGGRRLILLLAAFLTSIAPGGAAAATVVNGDFESGTLSGWSVGEMTGAGNWFAYKGTEAPIGHKRGADPVQPPPQGVYAAIADQANPDTLILYQDLALEPGSSYQLSLLAYYNSYRPIAIPTPDTLSVDNADLGGQGNQQFRIDLMRPDAPIESVNPADILLTLFQTQPGNPEKLQPTKLTANLSSFAGQTVRLRIANAVHEEVFNAGVDAVSLSRSGSGRSPARDSSRFSLGKAKLNRKNGTAILPVKVPGPGLLTAKGRSATPSGPAAHARGSKALGKAVESVSVGAAKAGTVSIRLKPTQAARVILKRKHKLRVQVTVTYKPSSGSREVVALPVVLRLVARSRRGR